jgi:hypothetical protein
MATDPPPPTATASPALTPTATPIPLPLNIPPLKQRLTTPINLPGGEQDYGTSNCSIAVLSMALTYYKSIGAIPPTSTSDYPSLIRVFRASTPPQQQLSPDLTLLPSLSGNKLSAAVWSIAPEELEEVIKMELSAGNPVMLPVSGNLLAAQWSWTNAHMVLINGILPTGAVQYLDPWDGAQYQQPLPDLIKAALPIGNGTEVILARFILR